jgi:hypothetical protein
VRNVAFGTAPARPVMVPDTPPADPRPDPVGYAAVLGRDSEGTIKELALPGPIAGNSIPLTIRTACGGAIQVGWIDTRGKVRSFRDLTANIPPGTKLLAPTTPDGRVVGVYALTPREPPRAPGTVTRRTGAPAARARSGDKHAHDPTELMYSGVGGKVLSVR